MSWLSRAIEELGAIGLNAWGVAPGREHQALLPGCRSVVVFGSGGPDLWRAFVVELAEHPQHLADEAHPLDAFVRRRVEALELPGCRVVRAAGDETTFLDFRLVALEAGLGWHSKLGLLMHPRFGVWLGLRVAILTTEALEPSGALAGEGPCGACPEPCRVACPVDAVGIPFDIRACGRFHHESEQCRATCHSREACPEGSAQRYPEEAIHYHYHRRSGRRRLAERLGIVDHGTGTGPFW
ncbi:MAG TPA: hypothetical protein QGF58_10210 [Myxococcota bacterium]|nr:hypothetical protein [Myxococcota bacterium]